MTTARMACGRPFPACGRTLPKFRGRPAAGFFSLETNDDLFLRNSRLPFLDYVSGHLFPRLGQGLEVMT